MANVTKKSFRMGDNEYLEAGSVYSELHRTNLEDLLSSTINNEHLSDKKIILRSESFNRSITGQRNMANLEYAQIDEWTEDEQDACAIIILNNDLKCFDYLHAGGIIMNSASDQNRKNLAAWAGGINGFKTHALAGNGSVTLTLRNGTSAFLFASGPSAAITGVYGIGCTNAGISYFNEAVPASALTVTRADNTITIANANTNTANLLMVISSGSIEI